MLKSTRSMRTVTCRAPGSGTCAALLNAKLAACFPEPRSCRTVATAAAARPGAEAPTTSSPIDTISRRAALLAATAGWIIASKSGLVAPRPVAAAEAGFTTLLGYSQAPDLYLGYGADRGAPPLYSLEVPAFWDVEPVSKTAKSTMGMDMQARHPSVRKENAYVIALGGKDYRDSVLKDAKTALIVVAGGDPDLRQALTDGRVKQAEKREGGLLMYEYEIASDKRTYLCSVCKKDDTVFGLVVGAPAAAFAKDEETLRHIHSTFKLL